MSSENDRVSSMNPAEGDVQERRVRHDLRLVFESSCRITLPFFDREQGAASHTLYARQTLRDAYPELTQQEVAILFSAVERFHLASRTR